MFSIVHINIFVVVSILFVIVSVFVVFSNIIVIYVILYDSFYYSHSVQLILFFVRVGSHIIFYTIFCYMVLSL